MARTLLLALLLLTPALVGCLDQEAGDDASPPGDRTPEARASLHERMFAGDEAHDHANPELHQLADRMELLDHLPLGSDEDGPAGTHALALHEDTLFAASTLGPEPGITAIDVTDPTSMRVLGTWTAEQATGGDRSLALSEDGGWLFLANEGDIQAQEPGIRVLDVSDPANIEEVLYVPLQGGAHTVESITVDGTVYVFALNYGVQTFRLEETPLGVQLVKVGQYTIAGPELLGAPEYENPGDYTSWALRSVYAHDMRAYHDEELGPTLYIAYAYQGMHVLDINTPEAPQLLATWAPGGDEAPWYTHGVAMEMVGDTRLVVVGSEVFEERHLDTPSPVWVLDMTDIANPELLSTWVNPAGAGSENLLFSAHFYRLDQGRIHMAHYHSGVWVLDVSTPETQRAPAVAGAYLPAQDTGFRPADECCFGFNLGAIPVTMDATTADGVTFAADYQTGVYALQTTG